MSINFVRYAHKPYISVHLVYFQFYFIKISESWKKLRICLISEMFAVYPVQLLFEMKS